MFSAIPIMLALVIAFSAVFVCTALWDRQRIRAGRVAIMVGIAASLYCVAAGTFLLLGWHDPFVGSDPVLYGKAATQSGGRGGVVLIIIRFWPYVLMALGSYFTYTYWSLLGKNSASPS